MEPGAAAGGLNARGGSSAKGNVGAFFFAFFANPLRPLRTGVRTRTRLRSRFHPAPARSPAPNYDPPMTNLKIDFVSDVACPWCAVGLASLEKALDQLGGEVKAELHFQPFELNPQMAPEGQDVVEH